MISRCVFFNRPVSELSEEVSELIKEYYLSGEVSEALQCIDQLNAVYFHHEIVLTAFRLAVESSAQELEMFARLMRRLKEAFPDTSQVVSGFRRVHSQLHDIVLDAPHARLAFTECVQRGVKEGYLPADFEESLAAAPAHGVEIPAEPTPSTSSASDEKQADA
jgi:hypothetical protein